MSFSYFAQDQGIQRLAQRAQPILPPLPGEDVTSFSVRLPPILGHKLTALSRVVSMSRNQLIVELLQTATADLYQRLDPANQQALEADIAERMKAS